MQKVIGVTELQRRFRSVFDEVAKENVPYVLTRGSRPEAALISYADYLRFQALQERETLERFDELTARMREQSAAHSEDGVVADVAAARDEIDS